MSYELYLTHVAIRALKDILFSKLCFVYFDKFVFNIHNYKITKKADLVSDPVIGYHTSGCLRSGSLMFYK